MKEPGDSDSLRASLRSVAHLRAKCRFAVAPQEYFLRATHFGRATKRSCGSRHAWRLRALKATVFRGVRFTACAVKETVDRRQGIRFKAAPIGQCFALKETVDSSQASVEAVYARLCLAGYGFQCADASGCVS